MNEIGNSNKALIRVIASFIAFLICLSLVNIVTTSGGNVDVKRYSFAFGESDGINGLYAASYILYRPKTATDTNPAPAIVLIHGGSSNAFSVKNYSIEYARRGYVVVSIDLPGTGYSDMVGETSIYDRTYAEYCNELQKQLLAMNFISKDNMSAHGFSLGNQVAQYLASKFPENYAVMANLTGFSRKTAVTVNKDAGVNYWGINVSGARNLEKERPEEYRKGGLEISDGYGTGVGYAVYHTTTGVVHVYTPERKECAVNGITMQELAVPTDTALADDNLVFYWGELCSVLAVIAMVFFIVHLAYLLLSMDCFKSVEHADCPDYTKHLETKKQKQLGVLWIVGQLALFTFAYWALVTKGSGNLPATKFLPIGGFNRFLPYFLFVAVFQLAVFLIWHFRKGKKQGGNAVDYGFTWKGGAKETAANIAKSLVLAIVIVAIIYTTLFVFNMEFGINIQLLCFSLTSINLTKLVSIAAYFLIYVLIFTAAYMSGNITGRVKDTDHPKRDTAIALAKSAALALIPLLIHLAFNFLWWHELVGGEMDRATDHLHAYPLMVLIVTPIHTYLCKKTKSPWLANFVCALFIAIMICGNNSYNTSYFG